MLLADMNEVHNTDCLEAMAQMKDNEFDLAIVDPPYGIDIMHGGGQPRGKNFIKWERKDWDIAPPNNDYFLELKRVTTNQIIWGGNYFTNHLNPSSCWLIWDKIQRDFTFADFEMAWTSFDKSCKAFNMSRVEAYTNQIKIHPTQKPIALYKWILKNFAKEGYKILDTHLGSASSRIASHEMGYDFVGYEIDKDYFDASVKRYEIAIQNQSMFKPSEMY